jgi:hypothetical protein
LGSGEGLNLGVPDMFGLTNKFFSMEYGAHNMSLERGGNGLSNGILHLPRHPAFSDFISIFKKDGLNSRLTFFS